MRRFLPTSVQSAIDGVENPYGDGQAATRVADVIQSGKMSQPFLYPSESQMPR
jgi:UDP-N-acetylglucosamine 2-epimerase